MRITVRLRDSIGSRSAHAGKGNLNHIVADPYAGLKIQPSMHVEDEMMRLRTPDWAISWSITHHKKVIEKNYLGTAGAICRRARSS
jgi:hypothetical protein